MNKYSGKIIFVVLYILFFFITLYFFGNYVKDVLYLQFADNKNIIGKITNVEYKYRDRTSSYIIHYAFPYNEKEIKASFEIFYIFYDIFDFLAFNPYKKGKSILIVYNTNNNFYLVKSNLTFEIIKSVSFLFLLPSMPFIILRTVKTVKDRKKFEKKYGKC